jgi:hypothetical protein
MAELLRRGFAPIATVLSFIAEERSAAIDQATTEIASPANQTEHSKAGDQRQQPTAKPHWMLLQRVEISLRGPQVGGFKALAEAIVHRLQ